MQKVQELRKIWLAFSAIIDPFSLAWYALIKVVTMVVKQLLRR